MNFNINSTRGQTRFPTCVARVTCLVIVSSHLCITCLVNVNHVHRQYPFSHPELSGTVRCTVYMELLCISNGENDLPGFTKSDVDNMINELCTC